MSPHKDPSNSQSCPDRQDKEKNVSIDDILVHADARKAAPEIIKARVKENLHAHWKNSLEAQQPKRLIGRPTYVLAASLFFIALLAFLMHDSDSFQQLRLEQIRGDVAVYSEKQELILVEAGEWLAIGSSIQTPTDGAATILLLSAGNLRLDRNTKVTFKQGDHLILETGRLYFESSLFSSNSHIKVETLHGVITNTGTQFEVTSLTESLNIRVREGAVRYNSKQASHSIQSGYQLITQSPGTTISATIQPYDTSWSWIHSLAPQFELEGKTLHQFLLWISREHALKIQFSGDSENESHTIVLHGDIESMDLHSVLEVVFSTTHLNYEITEQTLLIRPSSSGPIN